MSANTNIEWAHHTVNFWWGCAKVSEGCAHCYAELWAKFVGKGRASWGKTGLRWIRTSAACDELIALDKSARLRGVRERVFINSMSDVFEDRRDLDDARLKLWLCAQILTHLDLLLLTKRPENVGELVPLTWLAPETQEQGWPGNLWLGFSAENQERFDERYPEIENIARRCGVPVLFLSAEPLIGLLSIEDALPPNTNGGIDDPDLRSIDWVICGGESKAGARPMHPDWARSLRDQCRRAEVPFFFKQWGNWFPAEDAGDGETVVMAIGRSKTDGPQPRSPRSPKWHTFPDGRLMGCVGKNAAGRMIDGAEWNEVPTQ